MNRDKCMKPLKRRNRHQIDDSRHIRSFPYKKERRTQLCHKKRIDYHQYEGKKNLPKVLSIQKIKNQIVEWHRSIGKFNIQQSRHLKTMCPKKNPDYRNQ